MSVRSERPAGTRSLLLPSLSLLAALLLAFLSAVARSASHFHASRILALLAVVLGLIAGFVLVPELISRLRMDLWSQLKLSRLTRRGMVFTCLVLIVGTAALNSGNNLLILVFSALVAALIVSGTVSNLVLHGTEVALEFPEEIHAGQQVVLFLTLRNRKRFFPSFALQLRGRTDDGDIKEGYTDFFSTRCSFPYIRSAGNSQVDLHCSFRRRGLYRLSGFELTTTFPFGFFRRGRLVDAEGTITVFPEILELGLLFRLYPVLRGETEGNRKGLGSGIYNIRAYQGGESVRHVHWKSTAKVGQLMVKDFVTEEDSPFHLVFLTYFPWTDEQRLAQFEKAVSYVASVVRWWQRKRTSFHFHSQEFDVAVGADSHREVISIMEFLTCVAPCVSDEPVGGALPGEAIVFQAGKKRRAPGHRIVDYLEL